MSATTDIASAVGQCVAAGAAVIGLGFIGFQLRISARISDIQSLQTFYHDIREHEQALLSATTDADKDQAFIEFMNILELYAAAINGNLFLKVSKRIVTEKLRDSVAIIDESSDCKSKLKDAITSQETFNSLRDFIEKERIAINNIIFARKNIKIHNT